MDRNPERFAPLTGVMFVVLTVAGFLAGGEPLDADAPGREVVDFYKDNGGRNILASVLIGLGGVALVFFASTLRSFLRDAEGGSGRLAAVAFGAGVAAATGFWVAAGIHFALAEAGDELQPAAAQALNALDINFFFPFGAGLATLLLATGLVARRTGALPSWLAWAGIVLFVAFFTPAGFFAFILSGVWVIVVSVLLFQRQAKAGTATQPA